MCNAKIVKCLLEVGDTVKGQIRYDSVFGAGSVLESVAR